MKASPIATIVLTGFLGSGKTTLLRRLLSGKEWPDTAIIVNELGEVGLDHRLLWQSAGEVMLLEGGCICCSIGENLVETLEALFWNRLHRKLPYFRRVVIETTGLADPRSITAALRTNPLLNERYGPALVVCTVDADRGAEPLERHPESLAQVVAAHLIVITKTDLVAPDRIDSIQRQLAQLNPNAVIAYSGQEGIDGTLNLELLDALITDEGVAVPTIAEPVPFTTRVQTLQRAAFHGRITTCTIRPEGAWTRARLQSTLEAVSTQFGDRILRLKGVIQVESEARPLVVQMVAGRLAPFEHLPTPSIDRIEPGAGCLVAIMDGDLTDAVLAAFLDG